MAMGWKGGRGLFAAAVLLLCAAAAAAPSRDAAIKPAPAWVDQLPVPALGDPATADRTMLLVDNQVSLLGDEPEWFYRRVSAVRTSAGVNPAAEISVSYDPAYASAALHGAWVERDGVRSDRLASARIETLRREEGLDAQLLDGQLTLHVVLDDVRVGDIVDYAVSVRGDNPVHAGHFAQRQDFAIGLATQLQRFRLLRPATRTLEQRLVGDGLEYTRDVVGVTVDERWQRSNVPALRSEDRTPDWYSDGPLVELSSMRQWSEVVDWALPLYTGMDAPEIAALAKDLGIERGVADEAAILAAIRFVQDEIRYTGVELGAHAYTPYPPAEVLRRRYGDCKDKAQLLAGLLRYIGLRADPALVHTQTREQLEDRLPSPRAFDHVIVRFEHGRNEYWIDATAARQRGDLAHRGQADFGFALLIAPGETALREMHARVLDEPRIDIEEIIDLRDADGNLADHADYTITTTYRGHEADRVRNDFLSDSPESIGEGYTEWVGVYYPGSVMQSAPTGEDDTVANTFTVREHYRIEDIWQDSDDVAGARDATFSLSEIDRAVLQPKAGKRRTPWSLGRPSDLRQRLTVKLDRDWPKEDTPIQVLTGHIDYDGLLKSEGHTLHMEGRLRTFGNSVAPSALADFRRDVARIENTLGYTVTHTRDTAATKGVAGPDVAWNPSLAVKALSDWRLLPLLGGLGLLWAWVAACGVKRSVSARWGMLFRPRATVRAGIVVWRPWSVFVLLMASSLATDAIDPDLHALRDTIGMGVIVPMMLAVAFVSFAGSWLIALLLAWVGRRFGGRGTTMDIVTALAWSQVPIAAVLPLTLLALALYGIDGLVLGGPGQSMLPALLFWFAGLLPMALWTTIIWFPAFAAAHRFSLAKSIWATFAPGAVLVVVGIAIIALVQAVSAPG